jgi:enoyl-CoA hydratase/carnithine racemase
MDEEKVLLTQERDGIAILTLNRPEVMNSFNLALLHALKDEIEAVKFNKEIRVVIITGAGPKAFCAGADLKERTAYTELQVKKFIFTIRNLFTDIEYLNKPVIAAVNGIATAAGCQLVASCDLAVAGESAQFATPGVNIGLFCSTPMVALSRNISRKAAMEMLLLGDMVLAAKAKELGLVNWVVPDADLLSASIEVADKIASKSPLTLAIGKQSFYRQAEMTLAEAYDYTACVMVENMLARDAEEGIGAFLEKRAPHWTGL